MKMGWNLAAPGLVFVFLLSSWAAGAESWNGECVGKLHRDSSGLLIGGGAGEDEGICLIKDAEATKVLAVCAVEQHCRVRGRIRLCKDVGECEEISKITSVRRR